MTATGTSAPLRLTPQSPVRPTTGTHSVGEIRVGTDGTVLVCAAGGSPGQWRELPAVHPSVGYPGGMVLLDTAGPPGGGGDPAPGDARGARQHGGDRSRPRNRPRPRGCPAPGGPRRATHGWDPDRDGFWRGAGSDPGEVPVDRRHLLAGAGAVRVGLVAGGAALAGTATPAAAANGDPLIIGAAKTGTTVTALTSSSAALSLTSTSSTAAYVLRAERNNLTTDDPTVLATTRGTGPAVSASVS